MRIRRSDPAGPGYRRRRAGAGFTYVDPDGRRVIDRELRDHFAGLVNPRRRVGPKCSHRLT
jgi:DNA topoisomerase IB